MVPERDRRKRDACLVLSHGGNVELHDVELRTWNERGLILTGHEQIWRNSECTRHPQSWWCQPDASTPPKSRFVRVQALRHEGYKQSADQVRSQAGAVGQMRLYREPGGVLGDWNRVACLMLAGGSSIEMHEVRVHQWDSRGLVLLGEERTWRRKECFRQRQSWWCQFGARDPAQPTPPSEIDLEEAREQFSWLEQLS